MSLLKASLVVDYLDSPLFEVMTENKVNELIRYWRNFYKSKGIDDAFIKRCLDYAKVLLSKDFPIIFDLFHFSLLLGIEKHYLLSVVYHSESHYRRFSIPKRSGGMRQIVSPYYSLYYVQSWIYKNILSKVKVSYCAHGFVSKKSILTNAMQHVDNKYLLKLDLKDFFSTITINQVIQVFHSFGFAPKLCFYLASICCLEGVLPQGAPTSPVLSNIVSSFMDNRLFKLCRKVGYRYSRYADDIAISCNEPIDCSFIDLVKQIISECGFVVNENKLKVYNGKGAKLLTGLSLSNNKVRVPRDYRRELKCTLHYIQKYGLADHMRRTKIKNPHYLETMIGKVRYWLSVEPENDFAKKSLAFLLNNYFDKVDSK